MSPIHYKRVSEESGKEVPWEETVRGYEFATGKYVVLSDEDLKRASPEATQTIDIVDFVDIDEISPLYFDKPYYLAPDKKGAKAYALLRETLRRTGKVGIAKVVIRTRQYLAAVVARGRVLTLELLRYAHELRDPDELDLPSGKEGVTDARARDGRAPGRGHGGRLGAGEVQGHYREDLMKMIEKRVEAGQLEGLRRARRRRPKADRRQGSGPHGAAQAERREGGKRPQGACPQDPGEDRCQEGSGEEAPPKKPARKTPPARRPGSHRPPARERAPEPWGPARSTSATELPLHPRARGREGPKKKTKDEGRTPSSSRSTPPPACTTTSAWRWRGCCGAGPCPRGRASIPAEKRLAVHVEDHPIDYGGFEGIIPKGQYGGGTVLLWDRGTWAPEGDPVDARPTRRASSSSASTARSSRAAGTWCACAASGRERARRTGSSSRRTTRRPCPGAARPSSRSGPRASRPA